MLEADLAEVEAKLANASLDWTYAVRFRMQLEALRLTPLQPSGHQASAICAQERSKFSWIRSSADGSLPGRPRGAQQSRQASGSHTRDEDGGDLVDRKLALPGSQGQRR